MSNIIDLLDAHTPQKEFVKIVGLRELCSTSSMPKKSMEVQRDLLAVGATTGREARSSSRLSRTKSQRILQSA